MFPKALQTGEPICKMSNSLRGCSFSPHLENDKNNQRNKIRTKTHGSKSSLKVELLIEVSPSKDGNTKVCHGGRMGKSSLRFLRTYVELSPRRCDRIEYPNIVVILFVTNSTEYINLLWLFILCSVLIRIFVIASLFAQHGKKTHLF